VTTKTTFSFNTLIIQVETAWHFLLAKLYENKTVKAGGYLNYQFYIYYIFIASIYLFNIQFKLVK
jgi:hypothetical protein